MKLFLCGYAALYYFWNFTLKLNNNKKIVNHNILNFDEQSLDKIS